MALRFPSDVSAMQSLSRSAVLLALISRSTQDAFEDEAPRPARATRPDIRYMANDKEDVLYKYKDFDL